MAEVIVFAGVFVIALATLRIWRLLDARHDKAVWRRLIVLAGPPASTFETAMVEHLPEPARRYFHYSIAPGAWLHSAVEINMTGKIGLGGKAAPNYRPMRGRQLLAPPHGLVWRLWSGAISGSDGATPATSWTRFWLFGFIPVVRVGGNPDHHRSAFGRVVAEAAFWAPASLLPGAHVRWAPVDADTAEAIVSYGAFKQRVAITVTDTGQPSRVVIQRWSNENKERTFREQPFGGNLSGFKEVDGYRLPTRVEGGNHFGTDDYFPFYKADVTDISFPTPERVT